MSSNKQDTALVTYTDTSKESDVDDMKNGNCESNDQKEKTASTDVSGDSKETFKAQVNDEHTCEGKGTSNDKENKEENKEERCEGKAASNDGKDNNEENQDEESDEPWYINYKGGDCSDELFDDYASEKKTTTDEDLTENEELSQDENESKGNESSSEGNTDNPGIWCGRAYYSYRFGEHLSYSLTKLDTRLTSSKSKYQSKGRTVDDINIDYYRKNTKFYEEVVTTDFVCDIMSQNNRLKSKKENSSTDEDDSDTVTCDENYYYSENFDEDDDDKPEGGNTGNNLNSADRDGDLKESDSVKEHGEEPDKNTDTQDESGQCKDTEQTIRDDDDKPEGEKSGHDGLSSDRDADLKDNDSEKEEGEQHDKDTDTANETEQCKNTEHTCNDNKERRDVSVQIGSASIEYDGDEDSTTEGESSFTKHYREVEEEEERPLRKVIQATKLNVQKKSNISLTIEQVGMSEEEFDVTVEDVTLQRAIIANYASSSAETIDPDAKDIDDSNQSQNTDGVSFAQDAQNESVEDLEAKYGSNAPFLYDDRLRSHILLCEYTNSEKFSEEGKFSISMN